MKPTRYWTRSLVPAALGIALFALPSIGHADKKPARITVCTWNVEWMFDDQTGDNDSDLSKEQSAPNRSEWDWKLKEVARVVGRLKPTILCLQEVENANVVYRLTKQIESDFGIKYRYAFIQGRDFFTEQDVAILYRGGLVQYRRREQSREMFESKKYYNVSKYLIADFEWGDGDEREQLTIVNLHLLSRPEKEDVRVKQLRLVQHWVSEQLARGDNVVITGDFNTEDDVSRAQRTADMQIALGRETMETYDDFTDLHANLASHLRSTHLINRQFDRILISPSLTIDDPLRQDLVYSRVVSRKDLVIRGNAQDEDHFNMYYDIHRDERDVSDHYPVMAEFLFK